MTDIKKLNTKRNNNTNIIIILGPAGVGKSTIIEILLKQKGDIFEVPLDYTTRSPRIGDEELRTKSVSEREFMRICSQNKMLLINKYQYGTFFQYNGIIENDLLDICNRGKIALFDITPDQILILKKNTKLSIRLIYLQPLSLKILMFRLHMRQNKEKIEFSLALAKMIKSQQEYNDMHNVFEKYKPDFILVNDKLEDTISQIFQWLKI